MYYSIQNGIVFTSDSKNEFANNYLKNETVESYSKEPYKYNIEGDKLVLNPNFEEEKKQIEREKINQLSLTKREVFLAVYKDKGITPEEIRSQITNPEALIEFDYANDYYRGNPLINAIGESLGYTTDELDYLYKTGNLKGKSC